MFPPERIVCLTEETVETLAASSGTRAICVLPPQARREKPRGIEVEPSMASSTHPARAAGARWRIPAAGRPPLRRDLHRRLQAVRL
jgi:hypothetical protein